MFTLGKLFKLHSSLAVQDTPHQSQQNFQQKLTQPDPAREAIVTQQILPRRVGQVAYQGSWWLARCRQEVTFYPGDIVYVVDRWNTTLYVEPDPFAHLTNSISAETLPAIEFEPEFERN
ncbi:NfeD family protein [Leptolyngbya sp. 'hensonii']|uniref:NfeD family protein n=1 Tax=Leptolyngbya sp. 'hensonii' TaxID=1922337 RepID=UPI0009F97E2A|nr:NfeD family protein [Leptolyngbya sp. 'hensonii']